MPGIGGGGGQQFRYRGTWQNQDYSRNSWVSYGTPAVGYVAPISIPTGSPAPGATNSLWENLVASVVTGPRGTAGQSGAGQDVVFQVNNSITTPTTPTGGNNDAMFTPTGWTRQPGAVSLTNQYLWASYRRKPEGQATWENFETPTLQGVFGKHLPTPTTSDLQNLANTTEYAFSPSTLAVTVAEYLSDNDYEQRATITQLIDAAIVAGLTPYTTTADLMTLLSGYATDADVAQAIMTALNTHDFQDSAEVQALIDAALTAYSDTTEVNALINTAIQGVQAGGNAQTDVQYSTTGNANDWHGSLTSYQFIRIRGSDTDAWKVVDLGVSGTTDASGVSVDVTNFGNNIPVSATDVQAALDAVDNLSLGGGSGTDDQTATEVPVDTTNFGTNIPNTVTNVQQALDAVDDLNLSGVEGITEIKTYFKFNNNEPDPVASYTINGTPGVSGTFLEPATANYWYEDEDAARAGSAAQRLNYPLWKVSIISINHAETVRLFKVVPVGHVDVHKTYGIWTRSASTPTLGLAGTYNLNSKTFSPPAGWSENPGSLIGSDDLYYNVNNVNRTTGTLTAGTPMDMSGVTTGGNATTQGQRIATLTLSAGTPYIFNVDVPLQNWVIDPNAPSGFSVENIGQSTNARVNIPVTRANNLHIGYLFRITQGPGNTPLRDVTFDIGDRTNKNLEVEGGILDTLDLELDPVTGDTGSYVFINSTADDSVTPTEDLVFTLYLLESARGATTTTVDTIAQRARYQYFTRSETEPDPDDSYVVVGTIATDAVLEPNEGEGWYASPDEIPASSSHLALWRVDILTYNYAQQIDTGEVLQESFADDRIRLHGASTQDVPFDIDLSIDQNEWINGDDSFSLLNDTDNVFEKVDTTESILTIRARQAISGQLRVLFPTFIGQMWTLRNESGATLNYPDTLVRIELLHNGNHVGTYFEGTHGATVLAHNATWTLNPNNADNGFQTHNISNVAQNDTISIRFRFANSTYQDTGWRTSTALNVDISGHIESDVDHTDEFGVRGDGIAWMRRDDGTQVPLLSRFGAEGALARDIHHTNRKDFPVLPIDDITNFTNVRYYSFYQAADGAEGVNLCDLDFVYFNRIGNEEPIESDVTFQSNAHGKLDLYDIAQKCFEYRNRNTDPIGREFRISARLAARYQQNIGSPGGPAQNLYVHTSSTGYIEIAYSEEDGLIEWAELGDAGLPLGRSVGAVNQRIDTGFGGAEWLFLYYFRLWKEGTSTFQGGDLNTWPGISASRTSLSISTQPWNANITDQDLTRDSMVGGMANSDAGTTDFQFFANGSEAHHVDNQSGHGAQNARINTNNCDIGDVFLGSAIPNNLYNNFNSAILGNKWNTDLLFGRLFLGPQFQSGGDASATPTGDLKTYIDTADRATPPSGSDLRTFITDTAHAAPPNNTGLKVYIDNADRDTPVVGSGFRTYLETNDRDIQVFYYDTDNPRAQFLSSDFTRNTVTNIFDPPAGTTVGAPNTIQHRLYYVIAVTDNHDPRSIYEVLPTLPAASNIADASETLIEVSQASDLTTPAVSEVAFAKATDDFTYQSNGLIGKAERVAPGINNYGLTYDGNQQALAWGIHTMYIAGTDHLSRINTNTGVETRIGNILQFGFSHSATVKSLAWHANTLYALVEDTDTNQHLLARANLNTGALTKVGTANNLGLTENFHDGGISTDGSNLWCAVLDRTRHDESGMYALDTTNGTAGNKAGTSSNFGVAGTFQNVDIDWDGTNMLMVTQDRFYHVSRTSSNAVRQGNIERFGEGLNDVVAIAHDDHTHYILDNTEDALFTMDVTGELEISVDDVLFYSEFGDITGWNILAAGETHALESTDREALETDATVVFTEWQTLYDPQGLTWNDLPNTFAIDGRTITNHGEKSIFRVSGFVESSTHLLGTNLAGNPAVTVSGTTILFRHLDANDATVESNIVAIQNANTITFNGGDILDIDMNFLTEAHFTLDQGEKVQIEILSTPQWTENGNWRIGGGNVAFNLSVSATRERTTLELDAPYLKYIDPNKPPGSREENIIDLSTGRLVEAPTLPTLVYYGRNQTERIRPASTPDWGTEQTNHWAYARFNATPDKVLYGADASWVTWPDTDGRRNVDPLTSITLNDNAVFRLEEGIWNIDVESALVTYGHDAVTALKLVKVRLRGYDLGSPGGYWEDGCSDGEIVWWFDVGTSPADSYLRAYDRKGIRATSRDINVGDDSYFACAVVDDNRIHVFSQDTLSENIEAKVYQTDGTELTSEHYTLTGTGDNSNWHKAFGTDDDRIGFLKNNQLVLFNNSGTRLSTINLPATIGSTTTAWRGGFHLNNTLWLFESADDRLYKLRGSANPTVDTSDFVQLPSRTGDNWEGIVTIDDHILLLDRTGNHPVHVRDFNGDLTSDDDLDAADAIAVSAALTGFSSPSIQRSIHVYDHNVEVKNGIDEFYVVLGSNASQPNDQLVWNMTLTRIE